MPKHKWNVNPPTTLTIPSVGPVHFVHSTRAKHLSITIKPGSTIRVTVPTKVSLPTARKFLQSKIPWVKRNLNKFKILQQNYPQQNLQPINKKEAKTILTNRINLLAQKYRFPYNRLFIRNQKTRWGSCSAKNNISLNMNLVRLPRKLQDYVILHELVHTKHKNHSKKFWAEIDRYVGDGKRLRKEIKNYRLRM
jgi:predicted metal-dependent hydrolase